MICNYFTFKLEMPPSGCMLLCFLSYCGKQISLVKRIWKTIPLDVVKLVIHCLESQNTKGTSVGKYRLNYTEEINK